MKKVFFIIFFLLINLSFFFSQNDSKNYSLDYLKQNFFPADEGSINEEKLTAFIESFCKTNQLNYSIKPVNDQKEIITRSNNIEIYFKGSGKTQDQLVIACPLNSSIKSHEYYDNLLSLNIIFDLILFVKKNAFNKNIVFLISGANEREEKNFSGLKYFLSGNESLSKTLVMSIDLLSTKTKIFLSGSSNRKPMPLVFLRKYLGIEKNGLDIDFDRKEIYKSRFFLQSKDNYQSVFLENNIPAITFSNMNDIDKNLIKIDSDYQKNLSEYFSNWIYAMDNMTLPLDIDYHYHYLKAFGLNIIMSESVQIVIIIIFFILMIVWFFFMIRKKIHYSLFLKGLPFFIIIYFVNLLLSFLPLILFYPISLITGTFKSYLNFPLIYFLNIFFIPLFIILISFEVIKKIYFPKHSNLFIYASAIFTMINLMIFIIIDISISYIYLWTIIIITITNFTDKFKIKRYLLYIISTIPFLILMYDVSALRNLDVIKDLNPILINIVFTFLAFPFKLLFLGVDDFLKNINKRFLKNIHFLTSIIFIIIFTIAGSMIITAVRNPEKKIINASFSNNYTTSSYSLDLNSNANIGRIILNYDRSVRSYYVLSNAKNISIGTIAKPYEISLIKNNSFFNYDLVINSKYPAEYINAYITTAKGSFPIESNYIFNKDANKNSKETGETYKFLIPRNIGYNLDLKISLYNESCRLRVEIIYPFIISESNLSLTSPEGKINATTKFIEEFKIEAE